MQYRVFGDTYVVRLQRGEEVLACLRELCEKESISLGTVSAIGAVNQWWWACTGWMNRNMLPTLLTA